jgi:hypothetical protein
MCKLGKKKPFFVVVVNNISQESYSLELIFGNWTGYLLKFLAALKCDSFLVRYQLYGTKLTQSESRNKGARVSEKFLSLHLSLKAAGGPQSQERII